MFFLDKLSGCSHPRLYKWRWGGGMVCIPQQTVRHPIIAVPPTFDTLEALLCRCKQAAPIFDQMPPAVAAGFVRRMRKTSSALIMANMDPQKAYAISLLLAGRSGAVRQQ